VNALFDLTGRVAVITGGAGLLGGEHAEGIASAGGTPVLVDVRSADERARALRKTYGGAASSLEADVASEGDVERILAEVLDRYGRVDILVNNAANNPQVDASAELEWSRLERFPLEQWDADLRVGLTGALLCSRVIGGELARRGGGVILNIASDLAVIAPDQRLYRRDDLPRDEQPVKPVSYSVVKTGLLGLTRYLATYWADAGVRVNALSPGGVFVDQPNEFVDRLTNLIPLGRMAERNEYRGAVVFLCSDASRYMTGQNVVVDGGRTVW
jgi:NAD(P)-dependent dehydrogenase (short-subunit alcohol dehydrogenase family)